MIIIAHRANLYGPDARENSPSSIATALSKGFHVEVDIRWLDGAAQLGHDKPQWTVPSHLYQDRKLNDKIFWHAKDVNALTWALSLGLNCFGHQNDSFVVTSHGYIWTASTELELITQHDEKLIQRLIVVSLLPIAFNDNRPYGICTDHPCRVKDNLEYNY